MKKLLIISFTALAACAMNEPVDSDADGESRLAAELRGYEQEGPAVSCVSLRELRGNRSAGEGAIVFDGVGRRLWVNRPAAGCPNMRFGGALQTRTAGSQLCRGDIATVFDPMTGIEHGSCGLGDFTPYRRES